MRLTRNELERRDRIVESLHMRPSHYDRLVSLSEQLRMTGVRECNGFRTEQQKKWNDTRAENIIKEATEILSQYGLLFFYQPDPRGAAIYAIPEEKAREKFKEHCFKDYVEDNSKNFKYWLTYSYDSVGGYCFYTDK